MSNNVRKVSDSYRTILIYLYYSVYVKQCQTMSDNVRIVSRQLQNYLIHQYYSVYVKQCQTVTNVLNKNVNTK